MGSEAADEPFEEEGEQCTPRYGEEMASDLAYRQSSRFTSEHKEAPTEALASSILRSLTCSNKYTAIGQRTVTTAAVFDVTIILSRLGYANRSST
jgi:hypothetical protein